MTKPNTPDTLELTAEQIIQCLLNWVMAQGSDIPKPQLTDRQAKAQIAKAVEGMIPEKKQPETGYTDGRRFFNMGYNQAIDDMRARASKFLGGKL